MVRIGRYEVLEEIGRGAMGVVYLAHDPRMRRPLALKTCELPSGLDADKARECRRRFFREAQSAGALSHPAIVTIYDVDEDTRNGSTYITMEYVPGKSLRDWLRLSGRFDAARAVLLGTTVAEGLHVAHDAGIVHRDIKPANILVRDPDGAFKIADFGIARFRDSDLTLDGSTLGSPAYMSPEQLRSREVDGRSDLFSLASVLYEALTGTRPFKGKDLPALSYAVVHDDPAPICSLVRDLPASLDGFFAKALAKEADERYQDGRSFAVALDLAWKRRLEPVTDGDHEGRIKSQAQTSGLEISSKQAEQQGSLLGESSSGSYKPRAPQQILLRSRDEQRITDLDVIPIRRGTMRDESREGEFPRAVSFGRIWSARRSWVVPFLVAAALAGLMAVTDAWRVLQVPVSGELVMEVESHFQGGNLRLLSDGKVVFVARFLGDSEDPEAFPEELGTLLDGDSRPFFDLAEGEHVLTVQVTPRGETRSYQKQIQVHIEGGGSHHLRIVTGVDGEPLPVLEFD